MEPFVFLDQHGKRWPRLRRWSVLVGVLCFAAVILFVQALMLPPRLNLPPAVLQLKSRLKALRTDHKDQAPAKPLWLEYVKKDREGGRSPVRHQATPPAAAAGRDREIRLGFYEGWDPNSWHSLKEHGGKLTHLGPDWLKLVDGTGELVASVDEDALALAREQGLVLMPLLRNLGDGDTWLPEAAEGVINGPADRQDAFLARLIGLLHDMGAGGVVLDWQQVDPGYRANTSRFLARLATALHRERLELWLCVSVGGELKAFDLDALAPHVDRFVALLHDEHAESDQSGPIASREFFSGWLAALVEGYGRPEQWIVSHGSYGYDWPEGGRQAEQISFADVMSRAGRSALTPCEFHFPASNPHFEYEDGGTVHTVWFLDAVTFLNQLTEARGHGAGGLAINRLGAEDPGLWQVLGASGDVLARQGRFDGIETLTPGATIAHVGRGNLITLAAETGQGFRRVRLHPQAPPGGRFGETYETFPRYLTILHQGKGPADGVALTFDDGPDGVWTPRILDILKARGVKATFFMIGANMESHPALVRRIVSEGHAIGVHTYSHPNVAQVSEERARLEFNATQRLIESITGQSTILFRPPYNADTSPRDPEELVPVKLAQALGYVTVTEDIDPEDWAEPGVEVMLERVKQGRIEGGDIILLHDAGGDRRQTVAALPAMIDYLQARGDRILPLSELVGIPMAQLMPPVAAGEQPLTRIISDSGFAVLHEMTRFFWAFMMVATGLTVLKTLAVSWLAVRARRRDSSLSGADQGGFAPAVTVLIAAFNEAKVIRDTLQAVTTTSYPGALDIVVVDDGSTDDTAALVAALADRDDRIRLLRQANRGKAMALRAGLQAARHDLVVTLDADTQFTPATIGHLVQPFIDPRVAAVSGRVRVGNPRTLFARFQSLEYTCGFNLDRRAYDQLDCIMVVPGAVGAFRLSAVVAAGGISTETLAEDTDLTLALHRCGYRIAYASRAVAWTEAPETLRDFVKQRFRWAFGTLQCLWKHRDLVFNPRFKALAWFSLPSAWFFNIFLVAISSLVDLILLASLVISPANTLLYVYFGIFLAADLVLATVACLVEREPLRQVWLVAPMRFVYRPVLNYVVVKALLRALQGALVGWGKLDRTASVTYKV